MQYFCKQEISTEFHHSCSQLEFTKGGDREQEDAGVGLHAWVPQYICPVIFLKNHMTTYILLSLFCISLINISVQLFDCNKNIWLIDITSEMKFCYLR